MNLEDFYRIIRNGHVRAQGIVDTVPDPLLVLDLDLCVETANRAFHETFKVSQDETIGKHLYELGNGQWDIPALRRLLEDVIPKSTAIIDYEVTHDFPNIGRRTMLLTAHRLHHPDNISRTLLLSMVDATERRKCQTEVFSDCSKAMSRRCSSSASYRPSDRRTFYPRRGPVSVALNGNRRSASSKRKDAGRGGQRLATNGRRPEGKTSSTAILGAGSQSYNEAEPLRVPREQKQNWHVRIARLGLGLGRFTAPPSLAQI